MAFFCLPFNLFLTSPKCYCGPPPLRNTIKKSWHWGWWFYATLKFIVGCSESEMTACGHTVKDSGLFIANSWSHILYSVYFLRLRLYCHKMIAISFTQGQDLRYHTVIFQSCSKTWHAVWCKNLDGPKVSDILLVCRIKHLPVRF